MKKNWKYSLLLIAAVFALAMAYSFCFIALITNIRPGEIRPFRESSMCLMMILCIILAHFMTKNSGKADRADGSGY